MVLTDRCKPAHMRSRMGKRRNGSAHSAVMPGMLLWKAMTADLYARIRPQEYPRFLRCCRNNVNRSAAAPDRIGNMVEGWGFLCIFAFGGSLFFSPSAPQSVAEWGGNRGRCLKMSAVGGHPRFRNGKAEKGWCQRPLAGCCLSTLSQLLWIYYTFLR